MKRAEYSRKGAKGGFSLLEVLVVVVIMMILAALSVGIYGWVEARKRDDLSKNQLNMLTMAVERYYNDHQAYPKLDGKLSLESSSQALYAALYGDEDGDGNTDEGKSVYLSELDPKGSGAKTKFVVKEGNGFIVMDPWGKPFRYRLGYDQLEQGDENAGENPDFDVWSAGKDGQDGTSDDVANFKLPVK